jgi:hypothetical protein
MNLKLLVHGAGTLHVPPTRSLTHCVLSQDL